MATVAEIDAAIKDIQDNGQSFTLNDITYNAATLSALVEFRNQLLRQEGRDSGSRPTFRAFHLSGMGYG